MRNNRLGVLPLMLAGLTARREYAIGGGGYYDEDQYMGASYEDDSDLDWDEDEIGAIDAEDEDYDDEIGATIGAHGRGTARKIQRLKQKRQQLHMKLQSARRPRRRNRIQRNIDRLNTKISRLEAKLERKVTRAVDKGRMSHGEAAALGVAAGVGAGALAGRGVRQGPPPTQFADQAGPSGTTLGYGSEQRWGAFPGIASPMAYMNNVQRTPPAGNEIRIPLLVSGSPVAGVSVVAGAGPTTITVAAQSRVIPYAGFEVVGLDIDFNQLPNPEALPNILVSQYQVDGEKNLLYDTQGASFAGQATGLGQQSTRRTISGLRENQIMQPNNTISASLTFRQDAPNPTVDVIGTLQIAAVCRTIWDPAVQR